MTKRQRAEHKLGNLLRAYKTAVRGFKGIMFMQTATARGLIPKIKKWRAVLAN